MTLEEYDAKMQEKVDAIRDIEKEKNELYEFQMNYMKTVLREYKKKITSKAQKYIYELFAYAVINSTSGSAILCVDDKEMADEIDRIIWQEIGDYLLDSPQIYETDGKWAIDCVFAGNYIPGWDGWDEE